MEKPQNFSQSPQAFDAVFFSGAKNGLTLIVATERRPKNVTYGIVYLMDDDNKNIWKANWLPITKLIREEEDSFSGGGILLQSLEPMRSWKVSFHGILKNEFTSEERKVEIDLIWKSDEGIFNYDSDMSVSATARAFAKESWNKQYFDDLKKAHQTHYEQMGNLFGKVKLEDTAWNVQKMPSFRDHSFGTSRDWKLMHRYIFHHVFLNDGTKMVIGVVCQPHTCSNLECGYISTKSGLLIPIDRCNLVLENHGESGNPSNDYSFIVEGGGYEYFVDVQAKARAFHYLGEEKEAKNIELFVDYKVDGIPGSGICEWNYRNIKE